MLDPASRALVQVVTLRRLINGMAELRASDPDSFATLIEVLQAAAESRQAANSPCWIAIDTPARGVPGLPEA